MPNPIKELLLGRGWAGQTISRSETVEHLNALVRQHMELNYHYQAVIRDCREHGVTDALRRVQKTARNDVGKLSETIHSCGGTPYNGTDLELEDFHVSGDCTEQLGGLRTLEQKFNEGLRQERTEVKHQMRTRGILEALTSNSDERLELLDGLLEHVRSSS